MFVIFFWFSNVFFCVVHLFLVSVFNFRFFKWFSFFLMISSDFLRFSIDCLMRILWCSELLFFSNEFVFHDFVKTVFCFILIVFWHVDGFLVVLRFCQRVCFKCVLMSFSWFSYVCYWVSHDFLLFYDFPMMFCYIFLMTFLWFSVFFMMTFLCFSKFIMIFSSFAMIVLICLWLSYGFIMWSFCVMKL